MWNACARTLLVFLVLGRARRSSRLTQPMATQNERVERQQAEGAANILMHMNHDGHQEMSLLKPEIGRRVALMHGTTKRRWERQARAF